MKKLIFTIAILFVAIMAQAAPVANGIWRNILLSDGTVIKAELRGDEFMHFYRAEDGRVFQMVQLNEQGVEVYAESSVNDIRKAHADKRLAIKTAEMNERQKVMDMLKAEPNHKGANKVTLGGKHVPYVGQKKCLCILVDFPDVKFKPEHGLAMWKEYINGENYTSPDLGKMQTVREYFLEQSKGQFEMLFDVVGPYTMPNEAAYYGKNDRSGNDVNIRSMITKAFAMANPDVDFKDYDWDNDGIAEPIFVLYPGRNEATGGAAETIWPHKGATSYSRLDGVYVGDYACSSELLFNDELSGIGVMCHEYSHCLGLADLYDVAYDGGQGVGKWGIMDAGNYLPNTTAMHPAGFSGYERWYCGWLEPKELGAEPLEVSGMKPITSDGDVYVIYNDGNRNEYYMAEYRAQEKCDQSLPNSGLLIYHVDYDKDAWQYNIVNSPTLYPQMSDHSRLQLVRSASGSDALAVYPCGSNALTNNSIPAAEVYNANTDGTRFLNKTLCDITMHDDGTMSFSYLPEPLKPTQAPEGAFFYESFDNNYVCGGNDGVFAPEANVDAVYDNEGWTGTAKTCYGGNRCIRLGKSSTRGVVKTPDLAFDGEYVLSFKAAPYEGEAKKLTISASGLTFGEKTFTLVPGEMSTFTTTVSGSKTIGIMFNSDAKRFFLDEVLIMPASDPNGITDVMTDAAVNAMPAYNLAGQRVGAAAKGIVIVGGKKVVK